MNLYNPFGQSAYIPAGFWLPGVGPIGRVAKTVIRGIVTTAAAFGTTTVGREGRSRRSSCSSRADVTALPSKRRQAARSSERSLCQLSAL